MRVLLTGYVGFIGSYVAKHLISRGDKVIGLDNLSGEYSFQMAAKRKKLSKGVLNVPTTSNDLSFLIGWANTNIFEDIDVVIHLGAKPGVRRSLTHPNEYNPNVSAFTSILEFCRIRRIPLVYASSSTVYGANTPSPFKEDMPLIADSYYGLTKVINEQQAQLWSDVRSTALRFFTVYGPLGRPDMAIAQWIGALKAGKPVTLYTHEGNYLRRDFTYIDDIVNGIVSATDTILKKPLPKAINLGNSSPEGIDKVVTLIKKGLNLNQEVKIVTQERPRTDAAQTAADVSLAKEVLGYNPKVKIEEGIKRTLAAL